MNTIDEPRTEPPTVGAWLGGRRGLFIAAFAVIAAGMALNWSRLAAVGAAPIILAFAPCAVMCGLGLCMKGGSGKSCSSGPAAKVGAASTKLDDD